MTAADSAVPRPRYALAPLLLLGLLLVVVHLVTNGAYGFHRDELATIDDARHMAWGFVAYPPLTPLMGRIALALFGTSLVGIRLLPSIALAAAVVLTGCMAAELGGSARVQVVAAAFAALAPFALIGGALYQYISFDYLWWVATAYFVIRVLRTNDARWWLAVGTTVGLGMLTKYSMAFLVAGILVGLIVTPARRFLANRWLWAGVALSLLIFLPHALWEARHDWITLTFLQHIHARDVRIGRANGFLPEQLYVASFALAVPLWIAGLWRLLVSPAGARFRMVAWMYLVPLVLLIVMRGRSYYLAGAYPMLIAAGTVAIAEWLRARGATAVRAGAVGAGIAIVIGAAGSVLVLPVGAVGSPLWNARLGLQHEFAEEIGWPDLARTVSAVYLAQPPSVRERMVVLAGNYGEAGAINLYRATYPLPPVISEVNSYFLRGYGAAPPPAAIVVGYDLPDATMLFAHCTTVARNGNRYGVVNEESHDHPDVYLCSDPRPDWAAMWRKMQRFG